MRSWFRSSCHQIHRINSKPVWVFEAQNLQIQTIICRKRFTFIFLCDRVATYATKGPYRRAISITPVCWSYIDPIEESACVCRLLPMWDFCFGLSYPIALSIILCVSHFLVSIKDLFLIILQLGLPQIWSLGPSHLFNPCLDICPARGRWDGPFGSFCYVHNFWIKEKNRIWANKELKEKIWI